ncbi:Multifunctional esterase [Rhodocyclaceae bacterium]|nr:Multifunctional esterase [Rhodocyclaceae bacterium]
MMASVTRLTQAGRLREATAAIQRALGGRPDAADAASAAARAPAPANDDGDVIDVEVRVIPDELLETEAPAAFVPPRPASPASPAGEPAAPPASGERRGDEAPGRFVAGSFANGAGTRPYKLFIPGRRLAGPAPLVVMLHGCKQNPDDFAAGTRMNELAQQQGWFVLYPGQHKSANQMGCWNWFQEADQQRGRGEPSIIADMTREIVAAHAIDANRVYVAGLSAGGAMAAIMATTYPELYAAAGIHSGLPHAAANDLVSALRAMKQGPGARRRGHTAEERNTVPTIVFHGDRDTTVHPCNGDEVIAQARWSSLAAVTPGRAETLRGEVPGGRSFSRTIHRDAAGRVDAEHWVIHGAGHAWSGGSAAGSYTDPLGPDASGEMLRFFLEHAQRD